MDWLAVTEFTTCWSVRMWTPSSLVLRHPTPHQADALFWRPAPQPRLRRPAPSQGRSS